MAGFAKSRREPLAGVEPVGVLASVDSRKGAGHSPRNVQRLLISTEAAEIPGDRAGGIQRPQVVTPENAAAIRERTLVDCECIAEPAKLPVVGRDVVSDIQGALMVHSEGGFKFRQ
jgi:hypothetical protein